MVFCIELADEGVRSVASNVDVERIPTDRTTLLMPIRVVWLARHPAHIATDGAKI